jgi:transcriptional regulator with GAF, ATPase, and Fis domain
MKIDENDFFKEITLRICGSLDLEKALWHCLLYVREVFPADELNLTVYDLNLSVLERVAWADAAGGRVCSDKVLMPPHLRRELEEVLRYPRVRRLNDASKDPIASKMAKTFQWPDSSVIIARLIIEGQFIGSLIVRANGKGRYNGEHEKLWSLVNEPAAVALANSRQYFELMKLKELIADDSRYFQDELRKNFGDEIVGLHTGLKNVMDQVLKVAPLLSPVLLLGETGTGKEVIANAIHNLSPRSSGPLIKVNCGAIPETLIDSELFGHEKGAFTGALSQKRGRFERANGGTIFLDEVSELPPQAQIRLLRVLQEKEIERVGGVGPVKVDIRVISATHRDPARLLEEGSFREDLYYRLGVFPINIPPLRHRKEDIPALVEYFVKEKSREMGLVSPVRLAPGVIDRLVEYDWPGNVREVSNVVERALIQSDGNILGFDDISGHSPRSVLAAPAQKKHNLRLEEIEARHIRHVMGLTGGRVEGEKGAADILGMNPGTLRHRMRKLGIPFGRPK